MAAWSNRSLHASAKMNDFFLLNDAERRTQVPLLLRGVFTRFSPPTEHCVNLVNMTSSHVWLGGVKKTPPCPTSHIVMCVYVCMQIKINLACLTDSCIISCSMKCPAYYTEQYVTSAAKRRRGTALFLYQRQVVVTSMSWKITCFRRQSADLITLKAVISCVAYRR